MWTRTLRWLRAPSFAVLLGIAGFATSACTTVPPLPPKAAELNHAGAAALAAGDLDTAEARLAVALQYSPRFTEAWVNLGYVALRRGRLEVARSHFAKARRLNPDLPAPHHALGLAAERSERHAGAEDHYRAALEVDPGFAPSRVNLARRLFARGAIAEASAQFRQLTQVAPEALLGHVGLAECLLREGRGADADVVIQEARARFGDVPELRLLVARQLMHRDAHAEAEALLAPLTNDPDPSRVASVWAWIGVARLARGDVEGARQAAREALAFDAGDDVARTVLAKAGAGGRGARQ